MVRTLSIALMLVLTGCGDDLHSVRVELSTDFVPGDEFTEVSVELLVDGRTFPPLVRAAEGGDDFTVAQVIGTFADVPSGSHTVIARLRGSGGGLVAERMVRVVVMGDQSVNVLFTRNVDGGIDAGPGDAGADAGSDGGLDAGTDAGPPPVPMDEFCGRWAAILCPAREVCCSEAPSPSCLVDIEAECQRITDLIDTTTLIGWDGDQATVTLAEARALVDGCDLEIQNWLVAPDGLFAPFAGTVELDGMCDPVEATPDARLISLLSCVPGLVCVRRMEGDTCQRPAMDGDFCVAAIECLSQRCEGFPTPNRCGSGANEGTPCTSLESCASFECEGPLLDRRCTAPSRGAAYCPRRP